MKKKKKSHYRVIVCRVGKDPIIDYVQSPFQFTTHNLIDNGLVQMKVLDDGVVLYCDEEADRKDLAFNRSIPARRPELPKNMAFVIEASKEDESFAAPGEMGVFRIRGNFLLSRHDFENDVPLDITDEDIKMYSVLVHLL